MTSTAGTRSGSSSIPVRVTDEIGGVEVNAIPYPAHMRRDVTVRVPAVDDDLVGPVWGVAYADPDFEGWWA